MDVITIDKAGELLIAAIAAIVAGGLGGAPLTAFLVSVVKRFDPNENVSSSTLQLVVGGGLTVVYWVAAHFGQADLFASVSNFVLAAGPALLALLATLSGSGLIYAASVKTGNSVFGYKRS